MEAQNRRTSAGTKRNYSTIVSPCTFITKEQVVMCVIVDEVGGRDYSREFLNRFQRRRRKNTMY